MEEDDGGTQEVDCSAGNELQDSKRREWDSRSTFYCVKPVLVRQTSCHEYPAYDAGYSWYLLNCHGCLHKLSQRHDLYFLAQRIGLVAGIQNIEMIEP
jgi:hypothetical protein